MRLFWSYEEQYLWARGQLEYWEFMKELPAMKAKMEAISKRKRKTHKEPVS